ncbi:hypothetical protein EHS25_000247 [Saitozyma podzolica]|uniref:Cysteine-rich transmembrane CYSTM domain-containing protein n=1 Tax=Saitozyma podzolica TaxID=1890683 RepID=A0A427YVX6_9TREE|nr:hypothetical protein EHS25_000247 [Saitozyma podzolica]
MATNQGNKPSYPQMEQEGQQMYQASDGKWYPTAQMPQNWQPQPNQQYPGPQQGYYGQQPMGYPQQGQTYVVQDGNRGNAGMGAGAGILAGLCAALLCFDLGACLC